MINHHHDDQHPAPPCPHQDFRSTPWVPTYSEELRHPNMLAGGAIYPECHDLKDVNWSSIGWFCRHQNRDVTQMWDADGCCPKLWTFVQLQSPEHLLTLQGGFLIHMGLQQPSTLAAASVPYLGSLKNMSPSLSKMLQHHTFKSFWKWWKSKQNIKLLSMGNMRETIHSG